MVKPSNFQVQSLPCKQRQVSLQAPHLHPPDARPAGPVNKRLLSFARETSVWLHSTQMIRLSNSSDLRLGN